MAVQLDTPWNGSASSSLRVQQQQQQLRHFGLNWADGDESRPAPPLDPAHGTTSQSRHGIHPLSLSTLAAPQLIRSVQQMINEYWNSAKPHY